MIVCVYVAVHVMLSYVMLVLCCCVLTEGVPVLHPFTFATTPNPYELYLSTTLHMLWNGHYNNRQENIANNNGGDNQLAHTSPPAYAFDFSAIDLNVFCNGATVVSSSTNNNDANNNNNNIRFICAGRGT